MPQTYIDYFHTAKGRPMQPEEEQSLFLQMLNHDGHGGNSIRLTLEDAVKEDGTSYRKPEHHGAYGTAHLDRLAWHSLERDVYVSLNRMSGYKLDGCHVFNYNGIVIDLDAHDDDHHVRDSRIRATKKRLNDAYNRHELSVPQAILFTGRGLALLYILKDSVPAHARGAVWKLNAIRTLLTNKYAQLLSGPDVCQVDPCVTDPARCVRMPGTVNQAVGLMCHFIGLRMDGDGQIHYAALDDWVRENALDLASQRRSGEKKTKKKNKTGKKTHPGASRHRKGQLEGLKKLIEIRKGHCTGCREYLLFAAYQAALATPGTDPPGLIRHLNSLFSAPLADSEVESIHIKHTRNRHRPHAHRQDYYVLSNAILVDHLHITDEEQAATGLFASKKQRSDYHRQSRRAGRLEWLSLLLELKRQGLTYPEMADRTGLALRTIKRILNSNGIYRNTLVKRKSWVIREGGFLLRQSRLAARRIENRTPEENVAWILDHPDRDVWLMGPGGSGKTTLISLLVPMAKARNRKTVVLVPTGKAATVYPNGIPAYTIHSFLKIQVTKKGDPWKDVQRDAFDHCHTVVLDEVGMVRSDYMTLILTLIRESEIRTGHRIQLICAGDLRQLEPVAEEEDLPKILARNKDVPGLYAYDSVRLHERNWYYLCLTQNHRLASRDAASCAFRWRLENLAFGNLNVISELNRTLSHTPNPDAVYLCGRNEDVERLNEEYVKTFKNRISFDPHKGYENKKGPYAAHLELAVGMRVICTVNTSQCRNGETGVITAIVPRGGFLIVRFDGSGEERRINRHEYLGDGYDVTQFPLTYGHAITIHKAQGSTFDEVNLIGPCFSSGQLYTALTRCRDVRKIHLVQDLRIKDVKIHIESLRMLADTAVRYAKAQPSLKGQAGMTGRHPAEPGAA